MLRAKVTESVALKGVISHGKTLRLVPKDTCLMTSEDILTIRLALDKTWLEEEVFKDKFDHPISVYKGPSDLSGGLTCKACESSLIEGTARARVKGAPTENWREVVELWQCHNENYDRYIDASTQGIVVPDDVCLVSFNTLTLCRSIETPLILAQGTLLLCSRCRAVVGYLNNAERRVFLSCTRELQSSFKEEV